MNPSIPNDRKLCPICGHSNRASAKNCTQCGYAFFLTDTSGMLRKRCPQCGHMNRMGAKACSQCGHRFHVRARKLSGQHFCPQCGAPRRPGAKVCSNCGFRFKVPTEPPVVQSNALGEPISVSSVTSTPPLPKPVIKTPPEPPVVQSEALAEPISASSVTSTPPEPKKVDLSGEVAPYLDPDDLERLRKMGEHRPGIFMRLNNAIRDSKP